MKGEGFSGSERVALLTGFRFSAPFLALLPCCRSLSSAGPVTENPNATRKRLHRCAACGTPLFRPEEALDADTGFPTYRAPISAERVTLEERRSHGQRRTVVRCAACALRLGHRFDDATQPTGARYCIRRDVLAEGSSGAA